MSLRFLSFGLIALGSLGASGCARYIAKPLAPGATAIRQADHTFDAEKVAARLTLLAPSQHFETARRDRLALFSAMIENNSDIAAARAVLLRAIAEESAARAPAGPTLKLTTEYAGAAGENTFFSQARLGPPVC